MMINMTWHDMTRHDMTWHDNQHYTTWYDMTPLETQDPFTGYPTEHAGKYALCQSLQVVILSLKFLHTMGLGTDRMTAEGINMVHWAEWQFTRTEHVNIYRHCSNEPYRPSPILQLCCYMYLSKHSITWHCSALLFDKENLYEGRSKVTALEWHFGR